MSDFILFEVQVEILKKLPVKSLIRFRSVSKTWKSLIDSSRFIIAHQSSQQKRFQHLLVDYDALEELVSYVDDDTFPKQKVSVTMPHSRKYNYIIGCSDGLLCLYSKFRYEKQMAFIWNISIRKGVAVDFPCIWYDENGVEYKRFGTILGFGVCRESADPKIVKIRQIEALEIEGITFLPKQVEVFSLSTWAWRSPLTNLPRKSIYFDYSHVAIDGFLYWLPVDRVPIRGGFLSIYNLIMSFDLTSEEFIEINLPRHLAQENHYNLSISKLRESLVVLQRSIAPDGPTYVVWMMMMGDGVQKLFTKLFTLNVNTPGAFIIKGFNRSGAPIVEINHSHHDLTQLVVYDPCSTHVKNIEIDEKYCECAVYPYNETLLLLDQHKRLMKHPKTVKDCAAIRDDPLIS